MIGGIVEIEEFIHLMNGSHLKGGAPSKGVGYRERGESKGYDNAERMTDRDVCTRIDEK